MESFGSIAAGNSGGALVNEKGYFLGSISGSCVRQDRPRCPTYRFVTSSNRPYYQLLDHLGIERSEPTPIKTVHSSGFETGDTREWEPAVPAADG